MNLEPGVLNLNLDNLPISTSSIYDAYGQARGSSPSGKSATLRYSPSPEHKSPQRASSIQAHLKAHPGVLHSCINPQHLLEGNLEKFYGIDVNRCTDVSTLQCLLADGFRNFLHTTQWYECALRERNKTFAHRLGDLKKYISAIKVHEAPQTVVPATRRVRSGSILARTPRLTTDADGGVNRNGAGRVLGNISLHTDRGMSTYMRPHSQYGNNRLNLTEPQQNTPGDVKSRRSLSRPVLLKKPNSSRTIFIEKRLWNRPGTPVPVSNGRKTPLWHMQHNKQLLLDPSSARSRQHARHKYSGRNKNKGDDSTLVTRRPSFISSCKASSLVAKKNAKVAGILRCSDIQCQPEGANSSLEKAAHTLYPSPLSSGLERGDIKRKSTS